MKKQIILTVLILSAIIITAGCVAGPDTGSLVITNSDGTTVVLNETPDKIILLNSNAGEILYLLGDADKIIGISQSIANNEEQSKMYSKAEVVGAWNEPDVEYLLSLDADIVIGYATSKPKNAEVLQESGIPIVYIDCTKPETMYEDIIQVGKIAGDEKTAEKIAEYYKGVMEKVKSAVNSTPSDTTVYAESYSPYWGQGTDTGMGQLITIAGGTNIMTDTKAVKLSDEWVVAKNPDVIFKIVNNMTEGEKYYKDVSSRSGFDKVNAVKDGNLWIIRNDLTYGPRACAAAVAIAQITHPGILSDISAESVLKDFNIKFHTDFDTKGILYPEQNESRWTPLTQINFDTQGILHP